MSASIGKGEIISLYRSLLRAHAKCLPHEIKQLGDAYVQAEFRQLKPHPQTKSTQMNPIQLNQFHAEWMKYFNQIMASATNQKGDMTGNEKNTGTSQVRFGKDLSIELQSNLSENQRKNLDKLRLETSKKK